MFQKLNPPLKALFLTISFSIALSQTISASDSFKDEAEQALYDQGVVYRKDNKFLEAIECFEPLAVKKYVKAQHNLAFCFYSLGNEKDAYLWYRSASDQGFIPSRNNLNKMNLLFLLLPDEILSHTASFLTMQSLCNFKYTSQRASRIFKSTITRTNFLTSKNPYANDFRAVFSKVTFDPEPKAIRLELSAKVKKGSIEVHFRDSEHLRDIVKETPLIMAEDRLYFVRDNTVEDSKELVPTLGIEGNLQKDYFVYIIADVPLNISGEVNLPYDVVLPLQSDFSCLAFRGKLVTCGNLKSYEDAHKLATVIETFNEQLCKIRTEDAYLLLEDRKKSRLLYPEYYPDFSELCPDSLPLSDSEIRILQTDYITAKAPLVYIANSILAFDELQQNLPEFLSSIPYIDPDCSEPGVYCSGPLSLQKGFEVSTETDITMAGKIELIDHSFILSSKQSIWGIGCSTKTGGGTRICAGGSLYLGPLYYSSEANIKPKYMPEADWKRFLEVGQQFGLFN